MKWFVVAVQTLALAFLTWRAYEYVIVQEGRGPVLYVVIGAYVIGFALVLWLLLDILGTDCHAEKKEDKTTPPT